MQAGTNEAGRIEKVELSLPKGVKLTRVPDKSLSDMLAAGEIDCAIIARPPDCFRNGHKDVVRLYPDFWAMEEKYYGARRCGRSCTSSRCKSACSTENPWVARNLYNAFLESKTPQRRAADGPRGVALSGGVAADLHAQDGRACSAATRFPYGIEENRPTWEQMLRYTYEQGIAHRHAKPEEIFPEGHHDVGPGVTSAGAPRLWRRVAPS